MAPSARFTEDFAYEVLSVVGEIPGGNRRHLRPDRPASSAGTKTPASWPGSSGHASDYGDFPCTAS